MDLNVFDYFAGITDGNSVAWNVLCHYRAGSYGDRSLVQNSEVEVGEEASAYADLLSLRISNLFRVSEGRSEL